jgi:hypothetical protein
MRRKAIFEQPFATMPISDYASAFFYARRRRVTLRRSSMRPWGRVAISKAGAIDHRRQYFLGQQGLAKPT